MNVENINPFIEASQIVLRQMANIEASIAKPFVRDQNYKVDGVVSIVGITGNFRGQAMISMGKDAAMSIASSMMGGMPVTELDELSKSAVSELTNMILGNAATILFNRGIIIEITPPTLLMGENVIVNNNKLKTVCVPLDLSNNHVLNIDIARAE